MSDNPENHAGVMSTEIKSVYMVGAFPPPVHGMAAVNAAVRKQLISSDVRLTVINIAAKSLNRSFTARFGRIPTVLRGLYTMRFSGNLQGATLYMSVSCGLGQVYELLFLLLARRNKMQVYLHYHSFAYLDKTSIVTRAVVAIAGKSTTHITLSANMASCLKKLYPAAQHITSISNAVFFPDNGTISYVKRNSLKTIGFISNISEEKGIFDFLDLVDACEAADLPVSAIIAGPYQDLDTKQQVSERLVSMNTAKYIGPQYGNEKNLFYDSIDALVFPTRYYNEAEPLTIHEAMRCAIPVIAYGRGSIPEIVNRECGLVIKPESPFVKSALQQIIYWLDSPEMYAKASGSACEHFNTALDSNKYRWRELIHDISGAVFIDSKHEKSLENSSSKNITQ